MTTHRMAGADATWLHMDRPLNLMVVNTVLWFDGDADWREMESSFFERVVRYFDVFASRPVDPPIALGLVSGPRWESVDVRASDHVRRIELPSPGDDAALHHYIAGEAIRPLDPGRPLWQLHLIDGYRTGGAVLLRTHHALGDGPALMHVLATWAGQDSTSARRRQPIFDAARQSMDGISRDPAVLWRLASGLPTKAEVLGGQLGGTKALAWSGPMRLEHLKAIGAASHATVNDVALALVTGAIGRSVTGASQAKRVEAVVPMSIRPKGEPLDTGLGNRFGLTFASLPTDTVDLRERIGKVKSEMDRIKATREALIVFDALTALGATSKRGAQSWVDAFSRRASVVITNIVGARTPLRLGPTEVAGSLLWVPSTGPVGLGVSICSYAESVRFGVMSDTLVMADPTRLTEALDDEIQTVTRIVSS